MRIRHDAVFVSSVLFTAALLWLAPHNFHYASTWQQPFFREDRLWVQNYWMPIGFASLALILIGLIVIWTGYVRRVRWTWFVMFVIVWVFAFPVYMLPILQARLAQGSIDWSVFWAAIKGPGAARASAKGPLNFMLMVVALFLPVKSFFRRDASGPR